MISYEILLKYNHILICLYIALTKIDSELLQTKTQKYVDYEKNCVLRNLNDFSKI